MPPPAPRHLPPVLDRVAVLALALAIAALFHPRVAAFTTDSDSYLDVAKNLLAGEGLVMRVVDFWRPAVPDPLGLWPPLYPLGIAGLARLGVPLETAARAIPVASFAAFALAFHALALRTALRRTGALAVTALALATTGMARASVTAWSEMPYLALLALGVVATLSLEHREREGGRVFSSLLAGLLFGLASLTRYVGLLALPAGAMALHATRPPRASVGAWLLGALLPPLLWLARNQVVFGSFAGPPGAAPDRGAAEIARVTLSGLRWGLLPEPVAAVAPLAWGLLAILAAATLLAFTQSAVAPVAAAMALAHVVGVAMLRGSYMGERFLTPGYPFLWLAAGAVVAAHTAARGPWVAWARRALAAVLLVTAALDVRSALLATSEDRRAITARAAEFAELRRLVPPGAEPILTDEGHRVRHATGRATIELPGSRFRVREFGEADERSWREQGVALAVFRRAVLEPDPGDPVASEVLGDHLAARVRQWERAASSPAFVLFRIR